MSAVCSTSIDTLITHHVHFEHWWTLPPPRHSPLFLPFTFKKFQANNVLLSSWLQANAFHFDFSISFIWILKILNILILSIQNILPSPSLFKLHQRITIYSSLFPTSMFQSFTVNLCCHKISTFPSFTYCCAYFLVSRLIITIFRSLSQP